VHASRLLMLKMTIEVADGDVEGVDDELNC
jgi:hypothetical protein